MGDPPGDARAQLVGEGEVVIRLPRGHPTCGDVSVKVWSQIHELGQAQNRVRSPDRVARSFGIGSTRPSSLGCGSLGAMDVTAPAILEIGVVLLLAAAAGC